MAHGSKFGWLALLILASSASATTVGPIKGGPVTGRPLEVNIPFAVDQATERACASANVRYGRVLVPRLTLHVQGNGLKRNLLVTSPANVNEEKVTVNVRVGCGPKAVTRSFTMLTNMPAAKSPPITRPAARQAASAFAVKSGQKSVALSTPSEPLFPPPASEVAPQENSVPQAEAPLTEELRKARTDAAAAIAQLESTRRELAAILDVERRTSQTLINAEHQVRDAKSEAAHMRLVLKLIAAGLALAAAGIIWLEFSRVASKMRTSRVEPAEEPIIFSGNEVPT